MGFRESDMAVREYEGDGVRRVAIHECKGASIGALFACARDEGINNKNVNINESKGN